MNDIQLGIGADPENLNPARRRRRHLFRPDVPLRRFFYAFPVAFPHVLPAWNPACPTD